MAGAPRGWRDWTLVVESVSRRDRRGRWRLFEERRRERRRVSIVRQVPTRRNFCKDDDNRAFTVKPVYDALKTLGLIYDDSSVWVERHLTERANGRDHTTICIETIAAIAEEAHG